MLSPPRVKRLDLQKFPVSENTPQEERNSLKKAMWSGQITV